MSAVNYFEGHLHDVSIGMFNYAESVDGIQFGLLNFIRSNRPDLRLLPFFNKSFE